MKVGAQGFTLIELLTVVVIIGLLTAIAIPRFGSARNKTHRAQMQSSLKTLVSAQESYFEENTSYATDVNDLEFNQTPGVTIMITETDPNGWSAKASHASVTEECGFYIGNVSPPAGVPVTEGVVGCT